MLPFTSAANGQNNISQRKTSNRQGYKKPLFLHPSCQSCAVHAILASLLTHC